MSKTILEQLRPDNIPIDKQIDLLGQFLMENFGEEIGGEGRSEGAIEMAIRLIEEYKNARPLDGGMK